MSNPERDFLWCVMLMSATVTLNLVALLILLGLD
jgi:hypothetical protein